MRPALSGGARRHQAVPGRSSPAHTTVASPPSLGEGKGVGGWRPGEHGTQPLAGFRTSRPGHGTLVRGLLLPTDRNRTIGLSQFAGQRGGATSPGRLRPG